MRKVKLIDVCDVQYGYAFESSLFNEDKFGRQLIRIRDVLRGYSETYTNEKCSEEYVVNKGDLLVGMDGEFNIAQWKIDGAVLNQRVCKLTPHKGLHKRYLYYALIDILKKIEERTSFVTVKHLSAKEIKKIEFRLPSIEQQKEIADRLDKVVGLIEKRKEQLAELDQLVKSRFIEMFEKEEYKKVTVSSVLNTGFWLMPATPEFIVDGEVPYITSKNIKNRTIDFDNVKYISRAAYKSVSANRPTQKGDILISMIGTLGQIALIQDDREFYGQNLYLLRLNNAIVNTTYFCEFFNSDTVQYKLQGKRNQSTQAYLKANHVEDLILPLPPMELQEQFATFVEQADKSKFEIQQSIDKLETLKKSLMQQYFG